MRLIKYFFAVSLSTLILVNFVLPVRAQSPCNSQGLEYPLSYKVGWSPEAVAIGDFNGDGIKDLATGNRNDANTSILLGLGNGTFQNAIQNTAARYGTALEATDLNGDGKTDLIVASKNTRTLTVLLGNSSGNLSASFVLDNYPTIDLIDSLAVANFNNDGKTDVVINTQGTPSGTLFLAGNGDGTFEAPIFNLTDSGDIAAGDFNNDGKQDLAISKPGSIEIRLGNGTGIFSLHYIIPTGVLSESRIVVADFNNDGKKDIATSDVFIFMGHGNGTFRRSIPAHPSGNQIETGDLNQDGMADLVVTDNSHSVSVLLGKGSGVFDLVDSYSVGRYLWGVAIGDLNNDNKNDLAVTNPYPTESSAGRHVVSVLNGDGNGHFLAPRFYNNIIASSVKIFDVNNDGHKDITISDTANNEIAVHLGTWNGEFNFSVRTSVGVPFQILDTADFNNDGKQDLALSISDGVWIFLGRGTGYFQRWTKVYTPGAYPWTSYVGNFNQDNIPDLAYRTTTPNQANFHVFLGTGIGKFLPPITTTLLSAIQPDSMSVEATNHAGLTIGDINNDGVDDLIRAVHLQNNLQGVNVYIGNGNGTFSSPKFTEVPIINLIGTGDFNGDQMNDVVLGIDGFTGLMISNGIGYFSSQTLFSNRDILDVTRQLSIADFNGDNKLDIAASVDVGILFFMGDGAGNFSTAIRTVGIIGATGDINGDDKIDSVATALSSPLSGNPMGLVVSLNRCPSNTYNDEIEKGRPSN